MNIIRSQGYPKDGVQFVAIWVYDGKPWSRTFKFKKDRLHVYSPRKDKFKKLGQSGLLPNAFDDVLNDKDTRFYYYE